VSRACLGFFIEGQTEGPKIKAESGGEVLGEAAAPPHQLGRLGECWELL